MWILSGGCWWNDFVVCSWGCGMISDVSCGMCMER